MMKNKARFCLAFLVFASLTSQAQTISGVVNSSNHALAGATVYAAGRAYHATTDASGHYELKVKPGRYRVTASHVGYQALVQEVSLTEGQTISLDFLLALSADKLNDVVIVSSRRPQHISDIPGTVWVIDSTQLQSQIKAGVPLKEALAILIPGMDVGPQGRTNYGQNLRGRNVLVMIDGVSLNSTRGISRQFDAIDPFNIEKIEVLSGASAIYGGGATGGIINIVTKKAGVRKLAFETEVSGRSGLRSGDDHDLRVSQSVAAGNEWVKGRIGATYQKNGGAYDSHNNQVLTDITQTDLQYNRTIDVLGNVEFKLASNQSLSLTAHYYDSKFDGTKGLYLGPNLSGALGNHPELIYVKDSFQSDVVPRSKRSMANAEYHINDILGGQQVQVQAYGRTERIDFYPFPGSFSSTSPAASLAYMGSSKQNTDYYGGRLVLSKQWRTVSLTYGVDADREKFWADQVLFDVSTSFATGGLVNKTTATIGRYPSYHVRGLSGFAQGEWRIVSQLNLSAGIRQQHMGVTVDDFVAANQQAFMKNGYGTTADAISGGSNSYNVTLANAGLVYKVSKQQQAWFNYSQGFSLPDPAKYYGQGKYTLTGTNWRLDTSVNVGSTPLEGIKTSQYEAGYRYRSNSGFHAQGALFYALSNKNIQYVATTLAVKVVDDKQRTYGLEGEVGYAKEAGLEGGASGQWIRTELKSNDQWLFQNVALASPSKLTVYTGWKARAWSVRAQVLNSFNLKDDYGNKLAGFTTFDLVGHVKLPLGGLTIGIQNLLNRDYQTTWSQRSQILYKGTAAPKTFEYFGRGRTFSLTYTVNW